MADPWQNDPVVPLPRSRYEGLEVRSRTPNDWSPERLRAEGFEYDPVNKNWAKIIPQDPVQTQQSAPWEADPVVTDSMAKAEEIAAQRVAQGDSLRGGGASFYQGFGAGFADELAGRIAQGGQLASNAVRTITGQPIEINSEDLGSALTRATRRSREDFAQENRAADIGLQVAGGLVTGGGAIGTGVRGAALTGAVYGGVTGAGMGEGGVVERIPGAALGAATGGVLGGAVQGVGQVAAPYISRIAGITGASSGYLSRRGASPESRAAMRFVDSLDPEAAAAERARLQALGVQPSLIDVGGNATERVVRTAAGPAGPAADMAVNNAVARQANLKPEIMAVTQGLSPQPGTASQFVDELTSRRSSLAAAEYAPAYQARVPVSEDILVALADEPGRAALRRARLAAVARQDANQVQEIDALLSGSPPGEISAGTLDRVRIAMQGRGAAMQQRPDTRDIAGGLFNRAGQLDAALEAVPELAPARATYRNLSGAIDAVDQGRAPFTTAPEDFAAMVQNMTPEQRQAMIVGVRQEILDTLGGQRNAGTGSLQTISESPYARQNLEALLGPDEANQYIESIRARVQQTQRAQRVSPNTNSQTFGRSLDEETSAANMIGAGLDVVQGARGNVVAIGRTIDRIRARATMSQEERQAIAQLGLGSADELERIVQLADQARTTGRRPPREVRAYVLRARNVLGAQSPEQLQLERLLLPAPASAEEERQ